MRERVPWPRRSRCLRRGGGKPGQPFVEAVAADVRGDGAGDHVSYTVEGPDFPTAEQGFIIRAECDMDGDGKLSIFTVTHINNGIVHSGDDY